MGDGSHHTRRLWLVLGMVLAALIVAFVVVPAALDYFFGIPASPQTTHVESVEVDSQTVHLTGTTVASALVYRNYHSEVADGVMTVTLSYSFLGEGSNTFDIAIPTDGQRVHTIYLAGGGEKREIYPDAASSSE